MTQDRGSAADGGAIEAIAYFDELAPSYDLWTASESSNFVERVERFGRLIQECLPSAPNKFALDIGCGNGALTGLLSEAGFDVVGIDGSAQLLAHARGRQTGAGTRASFRQEILPLRPAVVDEFRQQVGLIVLSSVIEYVEDQLLLMQQCQTMLAPGGYLLASFPNAASLLRRWERLTAPWQRRRGAILKVQRHQHRLRDVVELAHQTDLTITGVTYFGIKGRPSIARLVPIRRPWLATLMLVSFRAAEDSVTASAATN